MKREGHITSFYVETLLMIVVMICILMVLTAVFGYAKKESVRAKHLTEAVTLAESTAQVLSAGDSMAECADLLGLSDTEVTGNSLTGIYSRERSGEAGTASDYRISVTSESQSDEMVRNTISVYYKEELIYSLDTARYLPESEEEVIPE